MILQHFRLTGSVEATECGAADTTTDVHRVGIERRAAIDTDTGSVEVPGTEDRRSQRGLRLPQSIAAKRSWVESRHPDSSLNSSKSWPDALVGATADCS
jgi:hypothetical protein